MQVDHIRNDFVHIPFSTSVQEGGSFSVAEGVNFGFSRTFDDAGPPPGTPVFFFQGILGRSRPEIDRLHRKCGRTQFWCRLTEPRSAVHAPEISPRLGGVRPRSSEVLPTPRSSREVLPRSSRSCGTCLGERNASEFVLRKMSPTKVPSGNLGRTGKMRDIDYNSLSLMALRSQARRFTH